MRHYYKNGIAACALAGLLLYVFSATATARAYYIGSSTAAQSGALSGLSGITPGEFVKNIGPSYIPADWTPQSVLQWFDVWLYGIAGFHILSLSNIFIQIISWLTAMAKNFVAWVQNALPLLKSIHPTVI